MSYLYTGYNKAMDENADDEKDDDKSGGGKPAAGPNHNKIAQSGDSDHNTTEIACAKWFFDLIGLNEKNLEYAKVFTTGSAFAFKRKLRVDGGSKAHHAKICLRHLLYEWQARMGLSAPQVHAQEQE